MTEVTRKKTRRSYMRKRDDPEPCGAFHNPGYYPWIAACIIMGTHSTNIPHVDQNGNEWS